MQLSIKNAADIGDIVKATPKSQGLRQDDAAGASGVGESFLGKVESGNPSVNWGMLFQLLSELGLAGKVGLNVPPLHRRYVPSPVYVINRFDRTVLDNTVYRLHSIDACQLLGIDATFKYQQGSILRLTQIAERC